MRVSLTLRAPSYQHADSHQHFLDPSWCSSLSPPPSSPQLQPCKFLSSFRATKSALQLTNSRLTVFIVAIVDWAKPDGEALSAAAIMGGLLIIAAFLLLSWSTYREMNEERRKRYVSSATRYELCSPCLIAPYRLEDEAIISDSDAES